MTFQKTRWEITKKDPENPFVLRFSCNKNICPDYDKSNEWFLNENYKKMYDFSSKKHVSDGSCPKKS